MFPGTVTCRKVFIVKHFTTLQISHINFGTVSSKQVLSTYACFKNAFALCTAN